MVHALEQKQCGTAGDRPPDRQSRETNAERAVLRVDNLSIPSPEPSTESAICLDPPPGGPAEPITLRDKLT
jgi:hypothetical protein